jgi:hypothetical protein
MTSLFKLAKALLAGIPGQRGITGGRNPEVLLSGPAM